MSPILLVTALIWAGYAGANGSSGIGNPKVPIDETFSFTSASTDYERVPEGVERKSDRVVLLKLEHLTREEADQKLAKFRPALLGEVKAWEYIADRRMGAADQNAWIVCGAVNACTQISLTPDSDFDAAALIGGLVKNK